ncbi:hypothetical protein [Novipirellula herctigrandis]
MSSISSSVNHFAVDPLSGSVVAHPLGILVIAAAKTRNTLAALE